MEIKLVYLSDLKFNLDVWKEELKFHKNEMQKFEKKLEEIASRKLGNDAMAPLEGFQNKIIREKEVIDKILQRIRIKRRLIESADLNEDIDGRLRTQQTTISEDMKIYIKLHYELKEDLMDYFLRWL